MVNTCISNNKRFVLSLKEGEYLDTAYHTVLEALKAAKKMCVELCRSVSVFKKENDEFINMAVINFSFDDFLYSFSKKKKEDDELEEFDKIDRNERKSNSDGKYTPKDKEYTPLLLKEWDE